MALPIISRYQSASEYAAPDYSFEAPHEALEGQHSFLDLLQTFANDRTESGVNHYFSFARWDDGHSKSHHIGSTLVPLVYNEVSAPEAKAVLIEGGVAFYAIPVTDKRRDAVMFALPTNDHLSFDDHIRLTNILAELIGVKGIVPYTYLPTYFFHFREGAQIEFHSGAQLGQNLVEEYQGVILKMKGWVAA